jgi:protein-disulfide isomerase/uncharacterized membrane protein
VRGGVLPVIGYVLSLMVAVYASVAASKGLPRVVPAALGATGVMVTIMIVSARAAGSIRRDWPTIVLVLLTGIGLTLAGLLTFLTVDQSRADGLVARVCSPDGQINACQQAFQSRWASFSIGFGERAARLPAVVAAVAFYTFLLAWYLIVGRPTPEERLWHLVPVALAASGTSVAAYLTLIMYTKLAGVCLLCLVSHVVTFLVFVATLLVWPRGASNEALRSDTAGPADGPSSEVSARAPTWHRPATALVFGGVLAFLTMQIRLDQSLQAQTRKYAHAYQQFADDPEFMRWDLNRQPAIDFQMRPDDSVRGDKNAPFVLINYGDYQCPQCLVLHKRLETVRKKFPGRLCVVFRHFPLDHACNPLTNTYMHAYSCQAARAAEAARLLGGDRTFWKMHDLLFEHRNELDARPYVRLAGQVGLRAQQFKMEMESAKALERVHTHVESSKKFRVATTPSVFLNGRRVSRWQSMDFWNAVLSEPTSQPASRPTTRGR